MTDADTLTWLRPSAPLSSGRYALDQHGRLHPERYARVVRAVAIVRVRCKPAPSKAEPAAPERRAKTNSETPAAGYHTAVEARPVTRPVRCNGSAPEGASGAVAGKVQSPANAEQTRPPLSRPARPDRLLAIEAKAPVDYSRTVAAMRARPVRKLAPATRSEMRCTYCDEPGPRVCEYCRAVEGAA